MTFQEIQEKLKKCELVLTSLKDGSYSNTKYTKEEALEKFNTIKESLEKKLNLLKEEETMFVSTKGGDTKAVSMDTKAAMDLKKDPNITGITTAKGKDLKEDDLSDEEQEEITTETSHTEVVAKEVHKAFIDALQETGHEVSEHSISSLNPETFTLTVKFKNNTQSDYSFEFEGNEVKLDGNILVTTNKKGVTPVLNKTIAKDNSVKYLQNLSEKKGKDHDGDGDIDSDDYMIAKDKAIKANMKEEESEPVVDKKGKYTGVRRLKLSDKDKETLKKIEDLLAKEKSLKEVNYSAHTKPKHFDICPGAESLRDELLDGGKTPEELGKWTYIHDELFKLEKDVLKSKKATDSDVKKAEQYASDLINISRDLGIDAGKVNYLKGHVDKIKKHSNVSEATKEEEEEFHKKLDTLVHKTFGKRKEELEEGPYQTAYIKIPLKDAKKALAILDRELGGDFMDIVDNDGDGNLLVYITNTVDNLATAYDAVMDLQAHGIEVVDSNVDLDEALDINDPALMRARVAKMRADDMKKLDALKKANVGPSRKEIQARALVQKLKAKRAEIEREMENDPDIEPTGGPVADMYGDQLNKIDNAIEKAASVYNKPMDYDTAVGKVSEDMDVGHVDDEPGMLKQDAYEIAQYSIQLFKLLKHYESLDVEIDFPNWWQRKVMLARDYISKATHYLDFKTNEPAIDSQAAALQEDEEPTKADLAKEKSLAKKAALLQFIASMQKKGILDKDKKVLDKDAYKKELDAFKKNVKEGRNLNELSGDQTDALYELQNILDDAASLGEQARDIIRQSFPKMLSKADAYGAFDLGSSANRYDTTLASIIEEIEEYYDEEEDLDEIGMFHDPKGELKEEMDGGRLFDYFNSKGYDITERSSDGRKPGFEGYMVSRGEGRAPQSVIFQYNKDTDKFTISRMSGYRIDEKEAIKAGMREAGRSGVAGIDSYMTDGNYSPVSISAEGLKDIVDHVMTGLDRESKAQTDYYRARGNTSGTIDEQFKVGQSVTYLGHPAKITFVGKDQMDRTYYSVSYDKGNGKTKASNIYNKGGEIKEGPGGQIMPGDIVKNQHGNYYMRVDGKVGGHDAYVRVINGKPGKKKTGLHDSFKLTLVNKDELNEGATCCGRCGRVHVKGSGCKRPYLKGKSHCRNK